MMADAALAHAPDPAEESGFDSLFVTAQDGLRLHVRRYGSAAARRLPIVCLPGLSRNGADFHELARAFGNEAAERCYAKAGFAFAEEKRDPAFEALTGSPGFRRFTRAI